MVHCNILYPYHFILRINVHCNSDKIFVQKWHSVLSIPMPHIVNFRLFLPFHTLKTKVLPFSTLVDILCFHLHQSNGSVDIPMVVFPSPPKQNPNGYQALLPQANDVVVEARRQSTMQLLHEFCSLHLNDLSVEHVLSQLTDAKCNNDNNITTTTRSYIITINLLLT